MKSIHTNRETDGLSNRVMSPSPLSLKEDSKFKIQSSMSLEERVSGLEARMRILEQSIGIFSSPESVDEFINSETGKAEYRSALVQLSVYRNKKPLEVFLKKTSGRVPR